jgi:hypothetical protein
MHIAFIILAAIVGIAIIVYVVKINDIEAPTTEPSSAAEPQPEPKEQLTPEQLILLGEVMRQAKERNDQRTIERISSLTYRGHMPVLKQDGSYTSYYYVREYSIAGINKRRGIGDYVGKYRGYLKPEPSNKFDPNAIAVYHEDGKHLGYIASEATESVRRLGQDFPMFCWGEIRQVWDDDRKFFVGDLYIEEIYADEARLPAYEIKKKAASTTDTASDDE